MKLLRTIPWFTRLLVGLFLVAQFAGMVSSRRADARAVTSAGVSHMDALHMDAFEAHHHQVQGHSSQGVPCDHRDCSGNLADACCALHACCAGLLPPAVTIATETIAGAPLAAGPDYAAAGARSGRLERPPRRPLH